MIWGPQVKLALTGDMHSLSHVWRQLTVTETAIGLVRALAACPSTTRTSLLGALAFVCVLVGPIAVRAEVISVPSTDPPNSAASLPLPAVLQRSPPRTARSVPICPPGYTLSPNYDYGCIGPSGGDHTEDGPQILAQSRIRALALRMSITPPP